MDYSTLVVRLRLTFGCWLLAFGFPAAQQPAQPAAPPTFRSSTDVVAVDVQVIGKDGHPLVDLGTADFEVSLNGRPRRVVSADLVRFSSAPVTSPQGGSAPITLARDGRGNQRMIVIAVDESSFSPAGWLAHRVAVDRFIDRLPPDDLVGVYVYPFTESKLELSRHRASLKVALGRAIGGFDPPAAKYYIGVEETLEISARDGVALNKVADRECGRLRPQDCVRDIQEQVAVTVHYLEGLGAQSLASFGRLMQGLVEVPGPKTVVLVTQRLIAGERAGARVDLTGRMNATANLVAAADVHLYVLHSEDSFDEGLSAASNTQTAGPAARVLNQLDDERTMAHGLERLAGKTNGSYISVSAGTVDRAFDRIMRETTSYYLLAVSTEPSDRDGRTHFLRVSARAKGADVHHRTVVRIPKSRQ